MASETTEGAPASALSDKAPKLSAAVQAVIGHELSSVLLHADPVPVGEDLFAQVIASGFLQRFWLIFGGNPSRWGGFPTGKELGLPINHLEQRLVFAGCSFDPDGKNCQTGQRIEISCAFVASVLHKNLDNIEMWRLMTKCLEGHDYVLVVALINHRFQRHFN
jgi:hypothetical protein